MAEYIERGALIDTIEGTDWYHVSPRGFLVHGAISDGNALYKADDIFKALENAPTVDVMEVVRCKDCEHHHCEQEPEHGKTLHFCSVLNAEVFKDFYCYHGTPKERGNG